MVARVEGAWIKLFEGVQNLHSNLLREMSVTLHFQYFKYYIENVIHLDLYYSMYMLNPIFYER